MKNKYSFLLFIGLVLLLLSFTTGCAGKAEVIAPKVYEFTVNRAQGEAASTQKSFQLKIGDRVDGEVSTSEDSVMAYVTDPYGNVIIGTSTRTQYIQGYAMSRSIQKYPWKFAFFAAIDGEYAINLSSQPDVPVYITITVYGK